MASVHRVELSGQAYNTFAADNIVGLDMTSGLEHNPSITDQCIAGIMLATGATVSNILTGAGSNNTSLATSAEMTDE